jgi:UPF0755 protein
MHRALKLLLILLVIAAGAVLAVGLRFKAFLDTPVTVTGAGEVFEIRPGASFREVSEALGERGTISNPFYFRLYARLTGDASSVQAGEYRIVAADTPPTLLAKFVGGDVVQYSFTIIEGWNYRDLISELAAAEHVAATMTDEDWPALLESLGSEASNPEGLFLPETYHFPKGTRDVDILRQAYELMSKTLQEEWPRRAPGLPLTTPYDALILASIIEKETALASERPLIAGVFVRRLLKGMRLQTDPTVIYGIGADFDGNLTRRDLRTDTPYNTYTRAGLPPTPIAMPGRASIHAALNPAAGTELYFVATGLGDGSHKFSETKEQHDAAVQEYLKRQRARD